MNQHKSLSTIINKLQRKELLLHMEYNYEKETFRQQTEAMGTDPAEFLGYNPFTASIEIKLNADYAHSDSISWIEQKIMKNKLH